MPGARAPVVVRAQRFPAVRGPHPSPTRSLRTCPHSVTLPLIHSFIHTLSRHFLICLPTHARTHPSRTHLLIHARHPVLSDSPAFIHPLSASHSFAYPPPPSFLRLLSTHSPTVYWLRLGVRRGGGALRLQRCTGTYSDVGDGKGPSGGRALAVPKKGCGSTQVKARSPEEGRGLGWGRA